MDDAEERQPLLTDDIRELLRLINSGDIAEILIKRGDTKVHIKRASAQPPMVHMVAGTVAQPASAPSATFAPPATTALTPPTSEPQTTGVVVTAPMVGTYYAAPTPKDTPYVQAGDEVRPGDVLGIIEAMKIMNEIECELTGHVIEVLVENGQPVEYGQPLRIIEPA
jgi:acetyl-CoA carboxylase biotin carboxyl carrier protein